MDTKPGTAWGRYKGSPRLYRRDPVGETSALLSGSAGLVSTNVLRKAGLQGAGRQEGSGKVEKTAAGQE